MNLPAGAVGNMRIEYWPTSKLIPYGKNPRRNDDVVDKIVESIRQFGFAIPILAKSTGEVIDGHLRLKGAIAIGMAEVPVIPCDDWSESQVRAFRITANRSVTWADWDMQALAREFEELKLEEFDLTLTGFETFELDSIMNTNWDAEKGEETTDPEWCGMPEYDQQQLKPWKTLKVHFRNADDRDAFAKLISQQLTDKTQYVWHPKNEIVHASRFRYETESAVDPRYPIYVISKGRSETRLTSRALEAIKVPYRIVVEPQERDEYAAVIDPAKILVLPFSNLGKGSIPARNWVWDHAQSEGHARHWILDDNIRKFYRFNDNVKTPLATGAAFRAAEDFVDRYTNVGLAGFQYHFFAKRKFVIPPFLPNTRIYSCILIDNQIPFRWRGRYNEDTDLSLRVLKSGLCTVLFHAFLAEKMATMTMKGGNTDELYKADGRLQMAKSLQEQHPDVVRVTKKWKRWQHHVDYRPFRENKFVLRPGYEPSDEIDNYGMTLQRVEV